MDNEAIIKIAKSYGYTQQMRQATEELSELIQAICKHGRMMDKCECLTKERNKEWYSVVEEMADVTIMMEQVKWMLGISDKAIEGIIQAKLNRELTRLGAGYDGDGCK